MKRLDRHSEDVLKSILVLHSKNIPISQFSIYIATLGRYSENSEIPQIIISLIGDKYIMPTNNPLPNNEDTYLPLLGGTHYFKNKWLDILYGTLGWLKVLAGMVVGSILTIIIQKVLCL